LDKELARLVDEDTPDLNYDTARGLATSHMKHMETYLDKVFQVASRDFPEGVTYLGCSRCTPEQEYSEATKRRNTVRGLKKRTKSIYETARSDLYLMKYKFAFNGKPLPDKLIYLPFVGDAGTIYISGSRFNISPVLSDRVISIDTRSVFVRLIRDKFTFERLNYSYDTNEKREIVQVVHSRIYHTSSNNKAKPSVPALTTAVHYLFCKYGLTETFKNFLGFEPIVVEKIVRSEWPDDQWVICDSRKIKPRCFNKFDYTPTNLSLVIPKHHYTNEVKSYVAAFFYVLDHFPMWISKQHIDHPRQWMLALGHMLFPAHTNHGRLYDDVSNHIESLDEYIDPIMRSKLEEIDIHVSDMYEFLAYIVRTINDMLVNYRDSVKSLYNKELSVVYHIAYDITSALFKAHFKLKSQAKKGLTERDVDNILSTHLKPGLIYGITKKSGVVSSNSYSGDNMAFKITSPLVSQSNSSNRMTRSKNSDRAAIHDPSKKMHVSIAEVASYSGMPKSEPTGRGKINHHCRTDHKGVIVRNPKFVKLLDEVQAMMDE